MKKKINLELPQGFCVLCTLWNQQPAAVLQHYIDHVSEQEFFTRMKLDRTKPSVRAADQAAFFKKLVKDPYGIATYFFVEYSRPC